MKLAIHVVAIYMFALSLAACGDGSGGIVEIVNHLFGVEHQCVSDHLVFLIKTYKGLILLGIYQIVLSNYRKYNYTCLILNFAMQLS